MATHKHEVRKDRKTGAEYTFDKVSFHVKDPLTGKDGTSSESWIDNTPVALEFHRLLQAKVPLRAAREAVGIEADGGGRKAPPRASDPGTTLVDWVAKYIETRSTAEDKRKNRAYLEMDIKPFFGDTLLARVTSDDAQGFMNQLKAAPCRHRIGKTLTNADGTPRIQSPKTVRNKFCMFHAALTYALDEGKINQDPARNVKLPLLTKKPPHVLSLRDFEIVRGAFLQQEYGILVEFMITSGLRFGEATALSPRNVDMELGRVYVERGWVSNDNPNRAPGESAYKLKYPKAEKCRYVFVDKTVLAKLDLDRKRPFVFTNSKGGPIRQHNFLSNAWSDAMARVADQLTTSRRVTPHNLRASYATWLLSGEVKENPLVVQQQLGHAHLSTTMSYYVHTSDEDKAAAAARIGARFRAPAVVDLDAPAVDVELEAVS